MFGLGFGSAAADAEESPPGLTRSHPIPSPEAFALRGTNGYVIGVQTEPAPREGGRDRVLVSMASRSGRVLLTAPAKLEDEGIEANLGSFGAIDVSWKRGGGVGVMRAGCGGRGPRIYVAEGFYMGSVRIVGEAAFTKTEATRIRGRAGWYRFGGCGYFVQEGFPGPGVLLDVSMDQLRQRQGAYRYLSVAQNRLRGEVSFLAGMGEKRGRISISRQAFAFGRARTLSFDRRLETALIDPPLPFEGTATFQRLARREPGSWLGDLVVDFPGRESVPLAGQGFAATFKRGYREAVRGRPLWRSPALR